VGFNRFSGPIARANLVAAAIQESVIAAVSRYPDDRTVREPNHMSERFTETLRAASEPGWSQAVGHRFVKELFSGAVPDAVMARYLIQDHRFLDSFLILLGAGLTGADTFEARLRLGRFIGLVSAEENTYFLRAELDRVGPAQADLSRDFFRRAVALEFSFFEAAYTGPT
jgi:thiaminase